MDFRSVLTKIGDYYTAQLRSNLRSDGNYATGDMDKSIYYDIDSTGKILSVKSDLADGVAILSISEGRKPSQKNPSEEMVDNVMRWMKARGMQPMVRNKKGQFRSRKGYSARRSSAYGVSKAILRKGYQGSDVIMRSYFKLESTIEKDIMTAFKEQVKDNLNKNK